MPLRNLAQLLVLVVVLAFVARYANSWLSGWRQLASAYEFRSEFDGAKRSFQAGWLRGRMRIRLTVGANPEGLYLAPWLGGMPGYPPLLIPWGEIQAQNRKWFWMRGMELRFRRIPSASLLIRRSLAEWLASIAGDAWPAGKEALS